MARLEDTNGRWLALTPLRRQFPESTDYWDGQWLVTRFALCDGAREWTSQPHEVATLLVDELRGLSDWLTALATWAREGETGPVRDWEALEPSLACGARVGDGRVTLDVRLNHFFRPPESNDGVAWEEPHVVYSLRRRSRLRDSPSRSARSRRSRPRADADFRSHPAACSDQSSTCISVGAICCRKSPGVSARTPPCALISAIRARSCVMT